MSRMVCYDVCARTFCMTLSHTACHKCLTHEGGHDKNGRGVRQMVCCKAESFSKQIISKYYITSNTMADEPKKCRESLYVSLLFSCRLFPHLLSPLSSPLCLSVTPSLLHGFTPSRLYSFTPLLSTPLSSLLTSLHFAPRHFTSLHVTSLHSAPLHFAPLRSAPLRSTSILPFFHPSFRPKLFLPD